MERKLYYAYVIMGLVDYFDAKLREHADKVSVKLKTTSYTEDGTPIMVYVLWAEEGIIDPKYEISSEKLKSL